MLKFFIKSFAEAIWSICAWVAKTAIGDKFSDLRYPSIKSNPKINLLCEVDESRRNDLVLKANTTKLGTTIPMDVLEENKESKRVMSAVILQSNIRKIRLKRYSNESEKIEKEKNIVLGNVNDTTNILGKVDSQNCEWNLLSKRAQRSAVIKYCNDLKFVKGEMIKVDKKVLTTMKSTLWEFIKENPEYEIDYSCDEETIVDISFLKVQSNSFQIIGKNDEIIKEYSAPDVDTEQSQPKKRKVKITIKKNNISDLSHD